jgi:hypothetical protein
MTSLQISHATRAAVVDTGGRFMTSAQMAGQAAPFGLPAGVLYFRGRVAAAGDVTAPVAVALLGIFPSPVVESSWQRTAAIPAQAAAGAYVAACAQWGEDVLGARAGLARLTKLVETVVDRAEDTALTLFAAWRHQPRPESEAARAAFAIMLLRELRGGLHFAALRANGVDVTLAVVADPGGGPARLARTGWQPDAVEALQARAARMPDLADRWRAAEAMTDAAFASCLDVLTEAEREELAAHLAAAHDASLPAAAPEAAETRRVARRVV